MDIHPKFSTWLAAAQITPGDESIRKWWTGISEFPIDRETIISLARVAFHADPDPSFEGKMVTAIQKQDAGFVPGAVALSILAATRLAVAIENEDEPLESLAALAIVCAHAAGRKKQPCLDDLAADAEQTLQWRSAHRADWNYLQTGKTESTDVDLLREVVGVCAEETNILWWVLGETSRDRNVRFGKIPDEMLPFVAGKELADLTMIIPGPPAFAAFADRVFRTERTKAPHRLDVATAIAALPADWRDTMIALWKDKPLLPLCPIAKAIGLYATAHGAQWPAEFAKSIGWPKGHKLNALQLALLTYRESLLLKAWNQSAP